MCGIFGYSGTKLNAAELVLNGLKRLEYRGYDSWGVVVKDIQTLTVDKHIGKIGNAKVRLPKSTIGIGHTRWATHGGVTDKNAHPHLDCTEKLALIHNGIVENFLEIKEELIKKGHVFLSETDTESIIHLIEEYSKKDSFLKAVTKTFNRLRGLNAIVIINATTNEIIAAKNGSPLIIGKGDDEYFIASDASGIIPHTRELYFLKDNELMLINASSHLYSLPQEKEIPLRFQTIDWKIEDVNKGNYKYFMIKEIHEQGKVILNIAQNYEDQLDNLAKIIQQAKGTFFIGAGTAYHAGLGGIYLFSKIAKMHVNSAVASEFNYLLDFINKKSLVIALSQSGETIDVIEPLNIAKQKGATIVALTNSLGSTIYRMSDTKILLGAGPEKAVASTKAYIAKLAILLMLSFALVGKIKKAQTLLKQAAHDVDRMLSPKLLGEIKKLATVLSSSEHMYTIGRGSSYSSAAEAALKIKEVSYIHTEGLAGGELKHGTIALISKGTPCLVFAPLDETYEAIISNATEIKARGGVIIGISPKKASIFDHWIEVKDIGEATVITQIVPAQLLAYYLALKKGNDPDKPRNLAKSVTVK